MTTVLRQPLKAVLGMLALLLAACGESHRQMVLQLEELERQNRADSLMLNDSLALRLTDYFDRYGSANERLRAHYILGRTYADMGNSPDALRTYHFAIDEYDTLAKDCDFVLLSKVYGQMASLYENHLLHRLSLSANKSASHYAMKGCDTLTACVFMERQVTNYCNLGLEDSALLISNHAVQQYKELGDTLMANSSLAPVIMIYATRKEYSKMKELLDRYEFNSLLFHGTDSLKYENQYLLYYYKGLYYYGVHESDSAAIAFQHLLGRGRSLNNKGLGAKGLYDLYNEMGIPDSVIHYANLYTALNDSMASLLEQSMVYDQQLLYNYSRHQSIANKEHERAERERKANNMLFLAVALALVAIGSIVYAWRRRKKAAEVQYESIAASLKRAEGELANLHALEAEKTDLQALSDELYRQIAAKEAAVGHLQKEIAQLRRENVPQVSVAEQQLSQSDLYRRLHQSAKCEAVPEEEWQAIDAMVRNALPGYHRFLSSLRYSPDSNEYRICLLLRLHIRMQDASGFIGISKSRLSQISTDILEDVFALKGSGKELQKQLERME